jgi:hypothetical protein
VLERAEQLLAHSRGGEVLNTAFIERLNGTFRERLASLTRKSRHAASRLQALHTGMYLIGCTYNFCLAHQELSKEKHWGKACTPAMASGLTDHVWSFGELLCHKVAPSPWVEPKGRGRPVLATWDIRRAHCELTSSVIWCFDDERLYWLLWTSVREVGSLCTIEQAFLPHYLR